MDVSPRKSRKKRKEETEHKTKLFKKISQKNRTRTAITRKKVF